MKIPILSVDLDRTDCRFILEALESMKAQWSHINRTSTDEDEQADYGNDLVSLGVTIENFEAAAIEVFGPGVKNFSRAPARSSVVTGEMGNKQQSTAA